MLHLVFVTHDILDNWSEMTYRSEVAILGAFTDKTEADNIANAFGGKVLSVEIDTILNDRSEQYCTKLPHCEHDADEINFEKCKTCKWFENFSYNSGINLNDLVE